MSATAWTEFHASLADVSEMLLRAAPDDATRAEGAAYLARLTAYGVERFLMGPERLQNGLSFATPRIGGYNPDYRIAWHRPRRPLPAAHPPSRRLSHRRWRLYRAAGWPYFHGQLPHPHRPRPAAPGMRG